MHQGRRRVAARVVASVSAVFWGFFWFGLIDLLVVVEQDAGFDSDYMFESGWGLLYLVLVTVPLVVLVIRPGDPVALAQLAIVTLTVLVGAVWRGAWPQLWNGLGLVLTVALLAWLGRGQPVRWRRPDPVLSVLALVGLPAAVVYGAPLIRNTTDVEDITNGVSHYPMQASLALAVVGLVALAAMTRSRVPAWTAALSAVWLGVESVVYPDLRASLGTTGGVLTAGWAGLVGAAVEVARRRTPTPMRRRWPTPASRQSWSASFHRLCTHSDAPAKAGRAPSHLRWTTRLLNAVLPVQSPEFPQLRVRAVRTPLARGGRSCARVTARWGL